MTNSSLPEASSSVVVVGGSLGAVSIIENLRSEGYDGLITLVGAEDHLPYDRPPLSKSMLRAESPDIGDVAFHPRSWYDEQSVSLVLGDAAVRLDRGPAVTLESGRQVRGDHVVLATGSRARRLPGLPADRRVATLRDWSDAKHLSGLLQPGSRVLLVGAGFIGLEVAASAAARGCEVTIVEREPFPLTRVLPAELAELCWLPYEEAGIPMLTGLGLSSVTPADAAVEISFSNGMRLDADAVVVAVGGQPNQEWLRDSGVEFENGILCDGVGATTVPNVWAIGDVACWQNEFTGQQRRVEQWQAAREHAQIVARNITHGKADPWSEPLYFWSDMIQGRVQFLGHYDQDLHETIVLAREDGRSIGLVGDEEGRLVGVFSVAFPRAIARGRLLLTQETSILEARTWASELLGIARAPHTREGAVAASVTR
jgi:3-phenylpropionate/trans-cinnamate dioxygenase ferredoxin reductase subunit